MKRILLSIILILGISLNIMAQSNGQNYSAIKINPLSALIKVGSVYFEHRTADRTSLQIGLAYAAGLEINDTKYTGLAVTPEFRYYTGGDAISGFYIGPFLRYQNYKVKVEDGKGTFNSYGGGVVFGRQWLYASGITLDIFVGPAYNYGKYKTFSGSNLPDFKGGMEGFGFRPGITLGFAL